jgi:hypothetical protein
MRLHRADVERAIAPGQAAGHFQAAGDADHLPGAIGTIEAHGVHGAGAARADIEHAALVVVAPSAICRALLTRAHNSMLKPGGNLMVSSGSAVGERGPGQAGRGP